MIENVVGSFLADYRRSSLLGNAVVLFAGEDEGRRCLRANGPAGRHLLTVIAVDMMAAATVLFRRRDLA